MTTTAAPASTLQPPAGAFVVPGSDPPLFTMFTNDWLTLQSYIVRTLQLPITTVDFESMYGTFADKSEVEAVVSAMKALQALSAEFGDPSMLMKELASDPGILASPTPPAEVYTHIVWAAYQITEYAKTFHDTLGAFMELLDPTNCGTPAQCSQALAEVLTGPGGLQSTATTAEATVNALIQHLSKFNEAMVPANTTIQTYTADSSQFYKDAVQAAGQDAKDVVTFQKDADAAYKAWEDYTIAAVTVSVGLVVLSGGALLPAAGIAAGILGHDAVEAREEYNTYCTERAQAAADEQKKQHLIADLGGLNTSVGSVGAAAKNFTADLARVASAWVQIGASLEYIVTNYTPDQLASYSWVNQALHCEEATQDWQTIAAAASGFTSNSLVPFDLSVSFGTPLPT